MPQIDDIRLRRDTLANWQAANPVLSPGEVGLITDQRTFVVGDGATAFNVLNRWGQTFPAGVDVYPNGDGAGLHHRVANNWQGYTNHLSDMPSLTWANYPGFSTPAGAGISDGTLLYIYHSAASRHFGILPDYAGSMKTRVAPGRYGIVGSGIRIDDGSQNNYVQLYVVTGSDYTMSVKYRYARAGYEAAAVSLFGGQTFLPGFVNLEIIVVGPVAYLLVGLETPYTVVAGGVIFTGDGWSPTQRGFYHEQNYAAPDDRGRGAFDAY